MLCILSNYEKMVNIVKLWSNNAVKCVWQFIFVYTWKNIKFQVFSTINTIFDHKKELNFLCVTVPLICWWVHKFYKTDSTIKETKLICLNFWYIIGYNILDRCDYSTSPQKSSFCVLKKSTILNISHKDFHRSFLPTSVSCCHQYFHLKQQKF